jgi:hypothetical protein
MPQHAPARRRTAPIHARRISGPARPRAVPAVALPAPGAFERIRALPDKRVVDRLLRGRLCIWLIGIMLGGIVAMQVSLLRMNAGISRAVSTAAVYEQKNSDLEAEIARSTTADKVLENARASGMIEPPAGETSFLTPRPGTDPALAVKRMTAPSETAINVMASGGTTPDTTVPAAGTVPAATATTTPVATPTPAPTVTQAQVTPVPTPVATPVAGTNGAATAPPQG